MLVFAGFEQLVLCVVTLSHVLVPVGAVDEGPVAEVAVVRPCPRVDVHVVLVNLFLDEALVAHLADEGHIGVLGVMLQLVVGHAARFDALTAVRASQERVHRRHVLLQGKRAPESLFAHFALDVLIGVMGLHVKSEKKERLIDQSSSFVAVSFLIAGMEMGFLDSEGKEALESDITPDLDF